MRVLCLIAFVCFVNGAAWGQQTYAEKLGWPKGAKVVIFHVDDAGMFYSANQGTIKSIEQGVATSTSIMMPCAWAASFVNYVLKNPTVDAGIHLTLTSEWRDYRWAPLAGIKQVPTLTDNEGALWRSVEEVVKHGSPDEIETEIRAQVDRAIKMGLKPTHLDSHMGTLFATPAFLERYIKVGIEYGIPVMFPGGNNKLLIECEVQPVIDKLKAEGKWRDGMELPVPEPLKQTKAIGEKIWNAGLPVLDDLHTMSGSWKPRNADNNFEAWGKYKTEKFKETLRKMQPGVAMLIVHSNDRNDTFQYVSGSGGSRLADMLSMMDPDLKAFLQSEGIILTTWRELMERRRQIK
ncbi:polysaccharide deacetylase family protein [Larkinella soli]|uniref:polysaccharide deacetylase family protein n=1 Tax=Larkinella soli TaxID=1770527 RepID=UPI000FFC1E59|nr:polysaccharide deacetylase family protein [Larkinella soli]